MAFEACQGLVLCCSICCEIVSPMFFLSGHGRLECCTGIRRTGRRSEKSSAAQIACTSAARLVSAVVLAICGDCVIPGNK